MPQYPPPPPVIPATPRPIIARPPVPAASALTSRSFTVAANSIAQQAINGTLLACIRCNLGNFAVALDDGPSVWMEEGQTFRLPTSFAKITIDNSLNGFALRVTLAWGLAGIDDNRQSDLDRLMTFQGGAFMGNVGMNASAGGDYSVVQLWNPVASGVLAQLRTISIGSATQTYGVYSSSTQLGAASFAAITNKRLDLGSNSKCPLLGSNTSAALFPNALAVFGTWPVPSNQGVTEFPFAGPVLIPPGYGINVSCEATNFAVTVNYEWDEL